MNPNEIETPRTDIIVDTPSVDGYYMLTFHARQLERELIQEQEYAKQGWEEAARLRELVPTTAQAMVYHSLLIKYEAAQADFKETSFQNEELMLKNIEFSDKIQEAQAEIERLKGILSEINHPTVDNDDVDANRYRTGHDSCG